MYGGLKLLALSGAQGMLMYKGLSVAIAHSTFKHQTDGDVAYVNFIIHDKCIVAANRNSYICQEGTCITDLVFHHHQAFTLVFLATKY